MRSAKPPHRKSRATQAGSAGRSARADATVAVLRDLSPSQVYARVLSVARAPSEQAVRRAGLPSSDAEDVALEVAARAAGVGTPGVAAAAPGTPLLAWVGAAARRVAMEHRRFWSRSHPDAVEAKELARRLRRRAQRREQWGGLASRHSGRLLRSQQALFAAFLEGLTDARIAQTAGLRCATVAERLWRIRRRLKNLAVGIDESQPVAVPGPLAAGHTLRGHAAELVRLRSEGKTYREMARVVGRTQVSVRSAMQRVRRALRAEQGAEDGGRSPPARSRRKGRRP